MQARPNASDLLARVAETFASCSAYRDEGEQITVFVSGEHPWDRRTEKKRFSTAFARPDRFFFEYSDVAVGPESEWTRGAIWADSSGACTWSTLKPMVEACPSIQHGIGRFAGVSGGTSSFAAKLLMPGISGRSPLPDPATARWVGEDAVEGRSCWKVEGVRFTGAGVMIWVDVSTLLVRQIRDTHEFNDESRRKFDAAIRGQLSQMQPTDKNRALIENALAIRERSPAPWCRSENTTLIRPEIGCAVHEAMFAFKPPA